MIVKKLNKIAFIIVAQTFTENTEATILCLNTLLKEVKHSDPERRSNGIRLMSSIANNDIYSFIYSHVLKSMNDLNPFVRRSAYAGLFKLVKNTEFGNDEQQEGEGEDSDEQVGQNIYWVIILLSHLLLIKYSCHKKI
jgi:hypothetical protein